MKLLAHCSTIGEAQVALKRRFDRIVFDSDGSKFSLDLHETGVYSQKLVEDTFCRILAWFYHPAFKAYDDNNNGYIVIVQVEPGKGVDVLYTSARH